jgi:hypothetical protein
MKFVSLTRKILLLPTAGITEAEAVEIAHTTALKHGWAWNEPIFVREGLLEFSVLSNANSSGGNVSVIIRASDGRVLECRVSPE